MTRITSSKKEIAAILKGVIPMYDTIEPMNSLGMARTYQKKLVGVVNESYKMVLPAVFKNIVFCKNGIIIAENNDGLFELFFSDGSKAMTEQVANLATAKLCALAF